MEEEPLQLNRGVVRDICILKLRFLLLAQPPEQLTALARCPLQRNHPQQL